MIMSYLLIAAIYRGRGRSSITQKKLGKIAHPVRLAEFSLILLFTVTTVTNTTNNPSNALKTNQLIDVTVNPETDQKGRCCHKLLHSVTNCYTTVTINCHSYKKIEINELSQVVTVNNIKSAGQGEIFKTKKFIHATS